MLNSFFLFVKPCNIKFKEDPVFHYHMFKNGQPKRSSKRHMATMSMHMKLEQPAVFK